MRQSGIHHVTAIAGAAHRNLDFYTGTLGLRLVKKTVSLLVADAAPTGALPAVA